LITGWVQIRPDLAAKCAEPTIMNHPYRRCRARDIRADPPLRSAAMGGDRIDGERGGTALRSAPTLLCPELIGRDGEVALLHERVDAAAGGRGGVVVLVAEAGTGKTRLATVAADAAAQRGWPVLTGRAVPGTHPVPYRALIEAFLGAFRASPAPDSPELAGLGAYLGRLVPGWRSNTDWAAEGDATRGPDDSPLLLAEAVLRLLRAHGGGRGCLLVLEDLHWADPETLAALDYLGDALATEPVLCVATARPEGAAAELLERLQRRDPTAIVRIGPLTEEDVDRMVAACLATPTPAALAAFVRTHGDHNPFLIEELLAGLFAAGTLRHEAGLWTSHGELTPAVPASLRESINRRMAMLDATTRHVLGAAALLGRRFDWELLPGIADVDGRAVVDALRSAVDEQIVAVEGSGFVFRHSLTREAVLADLLPPVKLRLAQQAWPVIERANPGLPGPVCELAAELAEAAGAPGPAAERLVESARRALAAGALTTAEATARRARRIAPPAEPVSRDADEVLIRVLVAAGQPGEARELALALIGRLGADEIARAAQDVDNARAMLGEEPEVGLVARLDAVAAAVAFDQVRLAEAAELAEAALAAAQQTAQHEVECAALEVLGRVCASTADIAGARNWFQREAAIAEASSLAAWHLRARHELAILSWSDLGFAAMRETRDLAARYGALITMAVMDLTLADVALMSFDREGCLSAAQACADASRRFGLATESVAYLWLAGAHALAGDNAAMSAAIAEALARDPNDPRILGDLYGRVLTTRSIVAGDFEALPAHLDTMIEYTRIAPPTTSVFPGRVFWATLHAIDDDDLGVAARMEYAETAARIGMPMFLLAADAIEAVTLGRTGDTDDATALMRRTRAAQYRLPLGTAQVHIHEMLIARAALRDGWGDPVTWLREAEAFFAASGYDHVARRCRTMLGAAGVPMPRRGRGESEVPTALRALGVTSREVDVLKLVADGLSNREIGTRLFLSTKTVERHVGSLLHRTGAPDRTSLGALARAHDVQTG
jgi:DNA-binding CsgD family transcriptional regulator/tetratricopeptide (TPR) repeat protein